MLVLTRKLGETITIGDHVKVTVVGIDKGQVRIGIQAPRDVIVHREEIYRRIMEENKRASQVTRDGLRQIAALWRGRGR